MSIQTLKIAISHDLMNLKFGLCNIYNQVKAALSLSLIGSILFANTNARGNRYFSVVKVTIQNMLVKN